MKLALDVENGPRLGTGPRCESYIYIHMLYPQSPGGLLELN